MAFKFSLVPTESKIYDLIQLEPGSPLMDKEIAEAAFFRAVGIISDSAFKELLNKGQAEYRVPASAVKGKNGLYVDVRWFKPGDREPISLAAFKETSLKDRKDFELEVRVAEGRGLLSSSYRLNDEELQVFEKAFMALQSIYGKDETISKQYHPSDELDQLLTNDGIINNLTVSLGDDCDGLFLNIQMDFGYEKVQKAVKEGKANADDLMITAGILSKLSKYLSDTSGHIVDQFFLGPDTTGTQTGSLQKTVVDYLVEVVQNGNVAQNHRESLLSKISNLSTRKSPEEIAAFFEMSPATRPLVAQARELMAAAAAEQNPAPTEQTPPPAGGQGSDQRTPAPSPADSRNASTSEERYKEYLRKKLYNIGSLRAAYINNGLERDWPAVEAAINVENAKAFGDPTKIILVNLGDVLNLYAVHALPIPSFLERLNAECVDAARGEGQG